MPVAVCRISTAQSYTVGPGDPECILAWNVEDSDLNGFHAPANPSRLTATQKGLYRFVIHTRTDYASSTGDTVSLVLFKNGRGAGFSPPNIVAETGFKAFPAAQRPWMVAEIILNAGDYVEALLTGPDAGQFVYAASVSMTLVTQLP